jgi:hypothetical protein
MFNNSSSKTNGLISGNNTLETACTPEVLMHSAVAEIHNCGGNFNQNDDFALKHIRFR